MISEIQLSTVKRLNVFVSLWRGKCCEVGGCGVGFYLGIVMYMYVLYVAINVL